MCCPFNAIHIKNINMKELVHFTFVKAASQVLSGQLPEKVIERDLGINRFTYEKAENVDLLIEVLTHPNKVYKLFGIQELEQAY